eukprot:5349258-Lingulodinium_polyedra.AAC.1
MHAEHVCKACRFARAMYVRANGKQGAGWTTRGFGQGKWPRTTPTFRTLLAARGPNRFRRPQSH